MDRTDCSSDAETSQIHCVVDNSTENKQVLEEGQQNDLRKQIGEKGIANANPKPSNSQTQANPELKFTQATHPQITRILKFEEADDTNSQPDQLSHSCKSPPTAISQAGQETSQTCGKSPEVTKSSLSVPAKTERLESNLATPDASSHKDVSRQEKKTILLIPSHGSDSGATCPSVKKVESLPPGLRLAGPSRPGFGQLMLVIEPLS